MSGSRAGTYDFVTPSVWEDIERPGDALKCALSNAGHVAADIIPFEVDEAPRTETDQ